MIFYKRAWRHSGYCLAWLDVAQEEIAGYVRVS